MNQIKGVIAHIGSGWRRAAHGHAISALPHRGPATGVDSHSQRRITLLGRFALPLEEGPLRLWSFGLPEAEKPEALRYAVEERLEKEGPSRWKDAFHILDDRRSGKFSVVRGEFDETPVRWTVKNGSLFTAPEYKAFSHPARLKEIHSVDPGCSLRFNPGDDSATLVNGRGEWPLTRSNDIAADEVSRKLERLIEEWITQQLESAPRPLALALSGGLDSSIAAWFVMQLGHRPPAYTVWYDAGTGEIPNDVVRSRHLTESWGLEHREIRVTEDQLDGYLEDMIWRSEGRSVVVIEGSLHWLILARRMAADGIRTCVSGQGSDHLFASFPEIMNVSREADPYKLWHENVLTVITDDRELMVTESCGLNVVGAFKSPQVRELALSLPIEMLWKEREDGIQGKQILRRAFHDRLPSAVTQESKVNIHFEDTLGIMLRRRYGAPLDRLRRYQKLRKKLLKPSRPVWWRAAIGKRARRRV